MKYIRTAMTLLSISGSVSLASACNDHEFDNSCHVNADCADSQAAKDIENVRCGPKDIYCLDDTCHAECRELCEVVRDDTNPCKEPRQCARHGDSTDALSFCTIMPVTCEVAEDCPSYRPILENGEQAEWTCEGQICRYPGVEYATR